MKAIYTLSLSLFLLASCEVDNYEAPEVTLTGKIVDAQTNKLVESGGINAGTVVRLYEGDSQQPLVLNTLPDGTFTNSKFFAGSYSYTAQGPFKLVTSEPQRTTVDQDAEIEIKVIPNVRLEATVEEVSGTTAKIKVKYNKVATDQKLVHLAVVWSKFPNPNNFTFAGGAINQEIVEAQNLTAGEKIFTITNLTPHTKYYLRSSGRTANPGNYYNYSTPLELLIQ
ncbi:DUF3823 domain-containing protein [Adhaeribacter aerolatus]|nr:DUF3823 domain-containing protein [Adhaeribacter aerolatus]